MATGIDLQPIQREDYLNLIRQAAAWHRENYESEVLRWRQRFDPESILARDFPRGIFISATFEAFLYHLTGIQEHGEQAKSALLQLQEIERWFPTAFGPNRHQDPYLFWKRVPAVPPEAYNYLKDSGLLSPAEKQTIENWLADYAEWWFNFHEWGAHNRTLWTTRDFARIIQLLPAHPEREKWLKLCRHLLKTSWGNWSIEDAQIYLPLWLSKIMHLADILEMPGLYAEYNVLYYLNYFLNQLAPHGMVTDYGDARWQECWHWYLTCFERGAKEYQQPEFKWAAARIFETKARHARPEEIDIDFPFLYECCDDTVTVQKPTAGSRQVMDELVGKKIVFRGGWEPESTFLMLNYKGDQDYGRCDRDYLRHSINVPAEKMHHGHADENAVCLLMSQGSVLLNDAGYRETLTNGMYRADFYHNRLVFRNAPPNPNEPLLNTLHQRSWYHPTQTEKIHFFNYADWDYSRTRVSRAEEGWEWDRVIVYFKKLDLFAVVDCVRVLKDCDLNISNLWQVEQVLNFGPNWFDTRFNEFYGWKNPGDRRLLIWYLPRPERKVSTEQILRNKVVNRTIYQTLFGTFRQGDFIPFVTLLAPHDRGVDLSALTAQITALNTPNYPQAVGVKLEHASGTYYLGIKCDLEMDLQPLEFRPRYTYERGKLNFGEILETDARFSVVHETADKVHYGFAEATRLIFKNKLLYEAPSLQTSLEHPNGDFFHFSQPKRDWWDDTVAWKGEK